MRWVVLALLATAEACAVMLIVQALARWVWVWVRWPLWFLLVGASLIATVQICDTTRDRSTVSSSSGWRSSQDLFRLDAPYPTYRVFLFAAAASVPATLVTLGAMSLLRWRDGGLRFLLWSVPWKTSFAALVAAFVALIFSLVINDHLVSRRIRKSDQHTPTLALRAAPPACSPQENAAPVYNEVGSLLEGGREKDLPDYTKDVNLLSTEPWAEFFARHAELSERLRQAATLPRCRFDIDWGDPNPIADYPEFGRMANCVRLLHNEGHWAVFDDRIALAVKNAAALRRIAEQLSEDPRNMALLLARAAEFAAGDVIGHILYVHQPTADEVRQLRSPGLEFHSRLAAFSTWQEAEYSRMLAMKYFGLAIRPEDYKLPGSRFLTSAILAKDRLLHAPDDLRALPRIFAEINRRGGYAYGQEIPDSKQALWFYAYRAGGAKITDAMDPGLYSGLTAIGLTDVKRRVIDFALSIAERGKLAEILEQGPDAAIPEETRPIDLLDGKRMKIVLADGGVVVYSGDDTERYRGSALDTTFCLGEAYKVRRLTPPKKETEPAWEPVPVPADQEALGAVDTPID